MKILLDKVTQVILHFGTDHGLSMSNIYCQVSNLEITCFASYCKYYTYKIQTGFELEAIGK